MENIIQVYSRNVYGRFLVYAANPEQAQHLTALTGSKTLETRHVAALEAMGFTFDTVSDPRANRMLAGHDLKTLMQAAQQTAPYHNS
jgi:hypothetical protein